MSSKGADIELLDPEARAKAVQRLHDLRRETDRQARLALIGGLVEMFTNAELHVIAGELAIGETLRLRALGLLAADEGFDGRRMDEG